MTEIKKYELIPLSEITDEAREVAISWVDNYEPMGYDLPNKQKLASDIMNYSKHENATLLLEVSRLTKENEKLKATIAGKILPTEEECLEYAANYLYEDLKKLIQYSQTGLKQL